MTTEVRVGGADAASLGKLVEGTNQDGLWLAAVKLEIVSAHSGADVTQVGVGGGDHVDGVELGLDIDLGVISIIVEVNVMLSDVSKCSR